MTSGSVETGGAGAVVNVLRTVGARPAVDADARVAAVRVGARGAVLAHVVAVLALVHVDAAEGAGERRRTLARVVVDAVDASRPVLAQVAGTVVDVLLAILPAETWSFSFHSNSIFIKYLLSLIIYIIDSSN